MAANLTPVPASGSSQTQLASDTVLNRFGQLTPTTTSTAVTSVNQTGEALFGRAFVQKTVYSTAGIVTTTFQSQTPGQFVISRVVYSTPLVVTNVTQYFTVVPSNTTVWNTYGTPSSLLSTAGQSDVVSYKSVVVADSEA